MRSTLCLAALLAASTSLTAQGTPINVPPFGSTFNSTAATRGYFFQAPIAFNIVGYDVPDETGAGVQNVEIYVFPDSSSPGGVPAFSATYTPTGSEFVYSDYGSPVTGTPVSTGTIPVAPGSWVAVVGACGSASMANSYATPSGPFATDVLGAPISIARCGTQVNISTTNGPNALFSEVAGPLSRVNLYVTPDPNFEFPPQLEMVSEMVPGTGTLGTQGGPFRGGEFLRFNFTDPQSNNAGLLIWNTVNFGVGGSPPSGVTAQIPGLVQVWPGSTPMGVADLIGPSVIGAPDTVLPVPVGLFNNGDTVRFQGIALDPRVQTATRLPVNPTLNTIEFRFTDCLGGSGFEGVSGVGSYPAGWSNGAGTIEWRANTGGTGSAGTGPTSAAEGSTYFYTETSSPATVGSVFSMNTDTMTNGGATSLDFQLSRIGVEIGQLEVFLNDGVNPPVLLNTYTGPDPAQSQGGVEWSTESLVLPQPLPTSYSFEFRYTCLPLAGGGSTFNGDLAIDDVCLR